MYQVKRRTNTRKVNLTIRLLIFYLTEFYKEENILPLILMQLFACLHACVNPSLIRPPVY